MKPGQIAELLPTHTAALFAVAVREASRLLRAGEVVALPTETVYGLAANAYDPAAVARIYEVKGRPSHNPIIVHVSGLDLARECAASWPAEAELLAGAFWPGPLTLVVPRSTRVPDLVTAGGATVGLRWPSHPFIQAVIRECGFPLAAPSANRSNETSPTSARHVQRSLGGRIQLVVDGGQSQVGIESTVVDLTVTPPRVLRPGMVRAASLAAVLGLEAAAVPEAGAAVSAPGSSPREQPVPRSPGQLTRHYSPRARLLVLRWRDEADLRTQLAGRGLAPGLCHVLAHGQIPQGPAFRNVSVIPHDAEAYARALYAELHRCDEEEAEWIVVEALPEGPAWHGIADRLRRAAAS